MQSVLNIEVTCFQSIWAVKNPKKVNLLKWLQSNKYALQVAQIRKESTKAAKDALKRKLPAITPSGIFKNRTAGGMVSHTGLLAIDIDYDDQNMEISNWSKLKDEMAKIPNIAYFGLSVSGKGYWGLIPIEPKAETHGAYFDLVNEIFSQIGISLDKSCRDVSRLRFYSYDPDAYFNHHAIPLKLPAGWQTKAPRASRREEKSNHLQFLEVEDSNQLKNRSIKQIQSLINQITSTPGHPRLRSAARLMGGFVSGGVLSKNEALDILNSLIEGNEYLSQRKKINGYKRTALEALEHGMASPITPTIDKIKARKVNWERYLPSKPNREKVEKQKSYAYLMGLYFENEILINSDGYPALWDTTLMCKTIDEKTKSLVEQIHENPDILEVVQDAYQRKFSRESVLEVM